MLEYPLWYAGFLFLMGLFAGYLVSANNAKRAYRSLYIGRSALLSVVLSG